MDYTSIKNEVKDYFKADFETGDVLLRKKTTRSNPGDKVGHRSLNGYVYVTLPKARKKVYAHHIIWFLAYGVWPPETGKQIDHINRCRDDNRLDNLRLVLNIENRHNNGLQPRGANSLRGSSKYITKQGSTRYKSQVSFLGKRYVKTGFYTDEEAHLWYLQKKASLTKSFY